ncbi:putative arginine deiminase [Heterostelium album PN500]|uniref:Putative arginine deiminase n=1 Tax=Heterostelium pallidum (strain ATCC 26659 / Pp 5 / PN500) TaxID=670386 RepID=D3BUK0_HETP5|nr:putative arginine deiminase [Heterostelium album PN500]EFA74788.1 putative arginine deiminase [Heterostelium album PN500]|eukprot:XP_020426922.1 putative arginine deiminase [Heterostelium album PN500]
MNSNNHFFSSNNNNLAKSAEIPVSDYSFNQIHENDEANIVILNEPSLAQWMGSIHPNGSLYEEPLDLSKAQEEHRKFRKLLEDEGCTVKTVREILTSETGDIAKRVRLEEFAFKCIKYELDTNQKKEELGAKDQLLLSDDYKRKCIDSMSVEQLVEVILTRPTIKLRKSERDTELLATEYSFHPLVNLVFQRDQQITTAKGIVMASLSSPIRAPEVELMRLCFDILGLPVVGEIPAPGKLEGGDFYPSGSDLCFIGVGLRSNFAAVDYLMRNDLFGTNRVAVVKDYFDLHQQRMHLDTVCNIINERTMLILEDICGEESPIRRLVDEYRRDPATGRYELVRHDIEFSKIGSELVNASVIRETRTKVLHDYSALHRELRKHNVDVHLFCHEPHHNTDQAVFVSEWFSTHSAEEVGEKTLVLYPMADPSRRDERRTDILSNGFSGYTRVVDFTGMENGASTYRLTTIAELVGDSNNDTQLKSPTLGLSISQAAREGQYLDFAGLVLDRVNKVVYCAVDEERYHSNVIEQWAKVMKYTLVKVKSQGYSASMFLFIGSSIVLFCRDALSAEDAALVEKQLGNSRPILYLTKQQMENSCSKVIEIGGCDKPALIISQACFNQLDTKQIELLNNTYEINQIDMSSIESLGGTGIHGMVGGLF